MKRKYVLLLSGILLLALYSGLSVRARTSQAYMGGMGGGSCVACHGNLQKMTELGYPQFYFVLAAVQAETGMPAVCHDCHLGDPDDPTVAGAHKGYLGLQVMKSRYRDIVRRKDLEGTPDYAQVSSIKETSADPRFRLQLTSPLLAYLWHDRSLGTAAWNPGIAVQTCGRCHPRNVEEFNTTEMGLVLTMAQYIPWIAPPAPGEPGTHLKVAPHSCGLWTDATTKPNNESFTDVNRQLYNSTSTMITPQYQDPRYPETSNDPLTKLQSIANQKNCNNCHAGCLDCHYSPFAKNVPGRMGAIKPAGTHTITRRPLPMTCMGGGRGQYCHGGPTDRRRGDGFVKGGFAYVPPASLQTADTKAYLSTPDVHYNSDTSHNATCVDCHGPLQGGMGGGMGTMMWTHGDMNRNPEPDRCAVCHPNEVAAYQTGNHKNLTCGACHTPKIVGYAFNFWTKGTRFGINPYPMERHESYAVNAMSPVLLKDEDGKWAPYHVHPHISAHINPSYLKVADYLSPRILWRNQPDIGIVRQHKSKDGVAVTGSYYGPDYGRDEGQVMVWLNIDKVAHSITAKTSLLPPRPCNDCHTADGRQRIGATFALRDGSYEDLYKGSYDIVADEKGLRIENLMGYKQDGTPSTALDPMKGKWSVPGFYLIPPVLGPATGHPGGM